MHHLEWTENAIDGLAIICLDRLGQWPLIDAAEQEIADKLRRDPVQYSENVSEGLRRIIVWPLVAYFSVVGDRIQVDAVGWIG